MSKCLPPKKHANLALLYELRGQGFGCSPIVLNQTMLFHRSCTIGLHVACGQISGQSSRLYVLKNPGRTKSWLFHVVLLVKFWDEYPTKV